MEGNIGFGLFALGEKERAGRVAHYVKLVGLAGFENAYPQELSGGMKQRVEVARALAVNPDVLFLDEPFGALDSITRLVMRSELLRIWRAEKKTILFVTHDIDESVQLADRVVVMSTRPARIRRIVDIDMPHPRDLSVAALPRAARLAPRGDRPGPQGLTSSAFVLPARRRRPLVAPAVGAGRAAREPHDRLPVAAQGRSRGCAELAGRGVLWRYIGDSLRRVASGYVLALVLGIPLGLALGWIRTSPRRSTRSSRCCGPITPIAWIPVAIVLFGVGGGADLPDLPRRVLPDRRRDDERRARACRRCTCRPAATSGSRRRALLARVVFPAALPQILVGLRIALGIAWLVVVAAEMIAVDSGLGYLIIDARNAGKRYDLVVAGMLLIGVIGLVLDTLVRRLERLRSVRWGFRAEAA